MGSVAKKTKRELDAEKRIRLTPVVVSLVAKGLLCYEIAYEVGIGRSTVIRWLDRIGSPRPRVTCIAQEATNEERLAVGIGQQDPETGCIPWTRGCNTAGYGYVGPADERRTVGAHKLTLELKLGRRLRAGELTRHTCDNPPCVNPDHLIVGTVKDNASDMMARGRGSSLRFWASPERVALRAKALALLATGMTQSDVGREVGVAQTTISSWVARYGRLPVIQG